MKRNIVLTPFLGVAMLFSGTSCSSFLDEEMKSTAGPDNVYTSTT